LLLFYVIANSIGKIVLVHVVPIFLTVIFKGIVSDSNQISGGRIIDVTFSKSMSNGEESCTQVSTNLGLMVLEVDNVLLSALSVDSNSLKIITISEKWHMKVV